MPYEAVVSIVAVGAVVVFSVVVNVRERARRARQLREAAARLYADARAANVAEHEYRLVSANEFRGIPGSGYEAHAAFLRQEGFRTLALVENLTLTRIHPENRTYSAVHVSADGRVAAFGWWLAGTQYLEFGSVTGDEREIRTSNAQPNLLYWPSSVDNCVLAAGTPPEVLLSRHRERIAELDRREPPTVLRTFGDIDAVLADVQRYRRQHAAYREGIGHLTLDEMLGLARNPAEERAARRLWAEITRQRQKEDSTGRAAG